MQAHLNSDPRRALTDQEIALIRRTFRLLQPIGGIIADLFYERLFYLAPSLRRRSWRF